MRLVSWNVNGIRAAMRNGIAEFINKDEADIYCFQEIKIHDDDVPENIRQLGSLKGYKSIWNGAEKKGYSGTAVLYKKEPIKITKGMGKEKFDKEGRLITLEYKGFYLINVYVPNSKRGLLRLDERRIFDNEFIKYCENLRKKKPLVICGDMNVAHKEIDLANPKNNVKNAGFTPEEREDFTTLLEKGYIDTFRLFDKDSGKYTWWSYRFNARERNIGWRIDYFLVSQEIKNKVKKSSIKNDIKGSDHCPIVLQLDHSIDS
ncbi:MAG: exodeoxyribonuclease III [Nanobdellota archaeon]